MSKLQPTDQEQELLTSILSYKYDPEGFVSYVFPWEQPNRPLQSFSGPRTWQRDDLKHIADHLNTDQELQRLGLPPRPIYLARASGRPGR